MVQWLAQHAAPIVLAATALLSGLLAALGLSVGALRRGLRADLEILNETQDPGEGHAALERTIEPRQRELAARITYPLVTVNDLTRITVLVAVAAIVASTGRTWLDEPGEVAGWLYLSSGFVAAALLFVLWWVAVTAWYVRMRYRAEQLSAARAYDDLWEIPRFSSVVGWTVVGWMLVIVPPVVALAASPRHFDDQGMALTVAAAGLLIAIPWRTIAAAHRASHAKITPSRRRKDAGKRRAGR